VSVPICDILISDYYHIWTHKPRFYSLGVPICDIHGSLIGVLEVCNKLASPGSRLTAMDAFDALDEEILRVVAVVVGGVLGHDILISDYYHIWTHNSRFYSLGTRT
jgi:hypothetical protein